jgi:carbon-monoxide dehydrogenase medium subunit
VKPPPFEYVAPTSVEEALGELARHGDEAKLLAGGQSLIPMLNMRLTAPRRLVDLNRVRELAYVEPRDGGLAIGAMTRQRTLERSPLVASRVPLLAEAVRSVGHVQIRTRGTLGGSLAHADPAAELPAVAVCLDARLTVRGPAGPRTVPARAFFRGLLTTALGPGEILVEAWFPGLPVGTGAAWIELARRHGDYALAGVGATVTVRDGVVGEARLALCGVGDAPVRATDAEALLRDRPLTPERLQAAADALRASMEPPADLHATAAYRRHLAGVLALRALRLAAERARDGSRP